MSEQAKWDEGLTEEQRATVEKAAKAAWEVPCDGVRNDAWESTQGDIRRWECIEQLAALRAVGVIPPAKVKTRGEVVAEKVVRVDESLASERPWSVLGAHPNPMAKHICSTHATRADADFYADRMRQGWAKVIDAERSAAFEEAAKWLDDHGATIDAGRIRAMKGTPP